MASTTTLTGKRIVITRPERDARRLARRLRAMGATPIVAPAIAIEFGEAPELDEALTRLDTYDWIVFTSRHGVEAVFRRRDRITGPRVAAIGPATAHALETHGVQPDVIPDEYVAEAVIEALGDVRRKHILLPRAGVAREALPEGLRARGAAVDVITAYRTRPTHGAEIVHDADAVTFTSSSTVRGFLAGAAVPAGAKVVCIGPITAATAREMGLAVHRVATDYTEDGLIAALLAAFEHGG